MGQALGLLMSAALPPTVLAYGIGLLMLRHIRLSVAAQAIGFVPVWFGSTLIALFLASEPSVASAQESIVPASLIAAVICLLSLAAAGRRRADDVKKGDAKAGDLSDTRVCPFCAEQIRAAAIVCRYCNRDVAPAERDEKESSDQSAPRALTDDELMEKYGISFDGGQYRFEEYRYSRLADAVSYAELQSRKTRAQLFVHEKKT
jgi:hypothetical protein